MKNYVLAGLLCLAAGKSFGQEASIPHSTRAKGYIGVSLGPSVPVGQFANANNFRMGARPGLQLNLVNFGYRFSDNVGVAFKWFGAANSVKFTQQYAPEEADYRPWSYGGLLIGPMASVPLSDNLELDFRPMFGISSATLPGRKSAANNQTDNGSVALAFGTTLQYRVSPRLGLHFGLDYLRTSATFPQNPRLEYHIQTLTTSVGLAVRLGLEQKAAEKLAAQKAEAPEKVKDPNARNGYLGVLAGPSFALGEFAEIGDMGLAGKTGYHTNVFNFGYRFGGSKFGIAVKGVVGANGVEINPKYDYLQGNYEPWKYKSVLVGPLFSVPVSEKADLNISPMAGFGDSKYPRHERDWRKYKSAGWAFGLTANVQLNLNQKLALQGGLEYYHTSLELPFNLYLQRISTLSPTVGVAYRLN